VIWNYLQKIDSIRSRNNVSVMMQGSSDAMYLINSVFAVSQKLIFFYDCINTNPNSNLHCFLVCLASNSTSIDYATIRLWMWVDLSTWRESARGKTDPSSVLSLFSMLTGQVNGQLTTLADPSSVPPLFRFTLCTRIYSQFWLT